jgi:hypothetical protein
MMFRELEIPLIVFASTYSLSFTAKISLEEIVATSAAD